MYLKSIELQGFKSFPDRTTIRFAGGLTAIVGPNGSGKSNISDAIRWVLGEQSTKSLRGSKMEDVIFGGTAKRSPLGFAEVSLILDNGQNLFPVECTELMVTRRYYRTGESEYYINQKHVRLKDVSELFMDTGLGRDGYSVIGQGRIDEILSVKSADRREVFEEAAGITRFRTRKEEAERRLRQTEENLVRIRDIWTELNDRSGPLAKQAESAKQYLELSERLRLLEVSLWMDAIGSQARQLHEHEEKLRRAKSELEQERAGQERIYAQSERVTEEIHACDIQTERLRASLSEAEQSAAELSRRKAVLEESRRNAQDNITQTKAQVTAQEAQLASLTQRLEEQQAKIRTLDENSGAAQAKLNDTERTLSGLEEKRSACRSGLETLRTQSEQLTGRILTAEARKKAAAEQLSAQSSRQDSMGSDLAASIERTERERTAQTALERELEDCRRRVRTARQEVENVRQTQREQSEALGKARREAAEMNSRLTDTRNRVRMLTELQRDYEGFSRAVKLIMSRSKSGQLSGVHGPVSALISVPDEYVTAIETALGAAASNIIVSTSDDGKNAIRMLKRLDGGRATFLPIDTIRSMFLREAGLERDPGFVGIAANLVTCQPQYRDIIANLLGRTVVASDLDHAQSIAKQHNHRFRIITLDGQMINAGGSMTGGSANRSSGILSRANQLEQLNRQARIQTERLSELTERTKKLEALHDSQRDAIAEAEQNLRAAEQEEVRLRATAEQHRALLDSLEQRDQQLKSEQESSAQAHSRLREEYRTLCGELERSQSERSALQDEIEQAERALAEVEQQIEQHSTATADARLALTEHNAQVQAMRTAAEELTRVREGTEEMLRELRGRIRTLENEIIQADEEQELLRKRGTDSTASRERLRQELAQSAGRRTELEAARTKYAKQAQEIGDRLNSRERDYAKLEAAALQLRQEEKRILDRMWEHYELTPATAEEIARPVTDRAADEVAAAELRKQVKALGPVNLAAVEEYSELSERLTFMTEQKDDLEKAQAELYEIIRGLTVRMCEIFNSEFAKLNSYFGQTFTEIFGGGHAELVLEDTSDVLGCGIEIRVTPPGKSVKTLMLLSGGEKALVAIALYFAILKVRPTPFCVLDEIEAALDDVNVARYAKYLRRLSDKTQFIVITHRRGTMEEADMLYGVTMQERGVSKLLMLNMAEAMRDMDIIE